MRLIRSNVLTIAIAAIVFALAFNDGSYSVVQRGSLAIVVWWALGLGVALGLLPLARPSRAALIACGLFAGLAALTLLSIAWSDSAERAFLEFDRVMLYLGVFALVLACSRPGDRRQWRNGVAIGIAAIGLLALGSRLLGDLGDNSDVAVLLPGVRTRLSYPVDYWNGLAILLSMAFPLLLSIAVDARRLVSKAAAVAVLPALVAAIYLTSSRGGAGVALIGTAAFVCLARSRIAAAGAAAIGLAGGAAAVAILLARDQLVDGPLDSAAAASQGESALIWIAIACLVSGALWAAAVRIAPERVDVSRGMRVAVVSLVALGALAALAVADPAERFETFKRSPEELAQPQEDFTRSHLLSGSGSGRWQFWEAAVDQFEEHPLVGDGAGSYEAWWAQNGSFAYFIRDAHSFYLELLGELGLVGFALMLAMLAVIATAAVRRLRSDSSRDGRNLIAALAAAALAFCVALSIEWVWELTAVSAVGFVLLALLVGDTQTEGQTSQPPLRVGVRVAIALFSLAAIVAQAIPVVAGSEVNASRSDVSRGDLGAALDSARSARGVQPWAASTQLQLALVAEQQGDYALAQQSIRRAIDRDSSDWRLWLSAARIETKLGNIEAARRDLEQAKRLNPRSPLLNNDDDQ